MKRYKYLILEASVLQDILGLDNIMWDEKKWYKDYFVRFGDIPKNEISIDHRTGKKLYGVSVYEAKFNHKTKRWELFGPSTGTTTLTEFIYDFANNKGRPCFLLKGTAIGEGSDGEILIKDIHIEKKLSIYDIEFDGESGYSYSDNYIPYEDIDYKFIPTPHDDLQVYLYHKYNFIVSMHNGGGFFNIVVKGKEIGIRLLQQLENDKENILKLWNYGRYKNKNLVLTLEKTSYGDKYYIIAMVVK